MQSLIFVCAVFVGGVPKKLENAALSLFDERTEYRCNYLENEFVNKWMNIDVLYQAVVDSVESALADAGDTGYEALVGGDEDASVKVINNLTGDMLYALQLNSYSGVFVTFGNNDAADKYGLYFHDNNPAVSKSDYSDITVEIAPMRYSTSLTLLPSSYNDNKFRFSSATDDWKNFFAKPVEAYRKGGDSYVDVGWWSLPYYLNNRSFRMLSYTVPLVNAHGRVYGVLGVEVSEVFLRSLMPFTELDQGNNGLYRLGLEIDGSFLQNRTVSSGYKDYIAEGAAYGLDKYYKIDGMDNVYRIDFLGNRVEDVYVSSHNLSIYGNSSAFTDEVWQLRSYINVTTAKADSAALIRLLVIIVSISTLLGIGIIVGVAYYISHPIMRLTAQVRGMRSDKFALEKIRVAEIDDLTDAIENLRRRVDESQAKFVEIIALTGLPIATFESRSEDGYLITSDNMSEILGIDEPGKRYTFREFGALLGKLSHNTVEDEGGTIYHFTDRNGKDRWIEMRSVNGSTPEHMLGLIMDVSDSFAEKQKLINERNIDSLTNIYNRRAFYDAIERVFSEHSLGLAAFVMMDLDNLKYINDTYGHDCGDAYIKATADTLVQARSQIKNCIVGRRSGDEFYVFLYGYESEDSMRADIALIRRKFKDSSVALPDGTQVRIRISAGISYYPKDSEDYQSLIRYADYAMYEIKNSAKGEFNDFNAQSYAQNSYLLRNNEELNRLIENERVEYVFQPIIRLSDASVFGYEALMRSNLESFGDCHEILTVAKAQFKLNLIERLTFFKAMETYADKREMFGNKKLFINSVSNQALSDPDWKKFSSRYGALLPNVVIELTEHEKFVQKVTGKKLKRFASYGCQIALDDFGTGYNGDAVLLETNPDYVKIDVSLIRNIDRDTDRQAIVSGIISYVKEKNIKCIAEGVETQEELVVIAALGCDFVQGFLFGQPQPNPAPLTAAQIKLVRSLKKGK